MITDIFAYIGSFNDFLWEYIAAAFVLSFGMYLSFRSRFVQVRRFPHVIRSFWRLLKLETSDDAGVHPLKAFFASVGGCVGIGNIVLVATAIKVGGPGALFWVWVTSLIGALIKFSEVYLGVKYRIANDHGGYDGGPQYYLQRVFRGKLMPKALCVLFWVYGVEIAQFNVVTTSLTKNLDISIYIVIAVLLTMVLAVGSGGVRRVGKYCSAIIPVFTVCFVAMALWVLANNLAAIPALLGTVMSSAFTGHAAIGAFAGSTMMLTMSQGVRVGCYTGDVGVGYAAVIHSETCLKDPAKQATLTIMEIFLSAFIICTASVLLVLVTGVWQEGVHESMLVQEALAQYFPYMNYFMPFFLFLLGFSTIVAYFCFGMKASEFLAPKWGRTIYVVYSAVVLTLFSFVETSETIAIMNITGAFLLIINVIGMFRMRRELAFNVG